MPISFLENDFALSIVIILLLESWNVTDLRSGILFLRGGIPTEPLANDEADGDDGCDTGRVGESVLAHVDGTTIALVKNDPAPLSKQSWSHPSMLSPMTTGLHSS